MMAPIGEGPDAEDVTSNTFEPGDLEEEAGLRDEIRVALRRLRVMLEPPDDEVAVGEVRPVRI